MRACGAIYCELFRFVCRAIPRLAEYLPGKLFGWGAELMLVSGEPAWPALGVSAGIIVAALVVAIILFRRLEV